MFKLLIAQLRPIDFLLDLNRLTLLAANLYALFWPPSLRIAPRQEIAASLPIVRHMLLPVADSSQFGVYFRFLDSMEKIEKLTAPRPLAPEHPLAEGSVIHASTTASGLIIVAGSDGFTKTLL